MFAVKDLRFTYPKNKEETIKGISFEIAKGEIFGFLGPSGAGKSTTQKILIKLLDRYSGMIVYDGMSIAELDESFSKRLESVLKCLFTSQNDGYGKYQFLLQLYQKNADIEALMKRVGLWEDRDKMVGEYSKGMKIRLNFVRAMLNSPEMLFLDEPTNGLDPTNAMILKDMIREFKKAGGTVFLTSHIMSDVDQLCDRVAFIVEGEIKEIDSPRNLKLKYGKRTMKLEYKENDKTVLEEFPMDGIGRNKKFIELLQTKDVETLHSGETTLEEIFIHVTGVGLSHEN